MWQERLADVGVAVESVDAHHVRLRTPGGDVRVVRLKVYDRALTPSKVKQLPVSERGLLVVPRATKQVEATALRRGWALVTDDRVVLNGDETDSVDRVRRARREARRPRRRGPRPRAALTAIRRLLAAAPLTQRELAARCDLSQPYLSKVLAELSDRGLVQRTRNGWQPTDQRRLIGWWLDRYPGPGGATSYWHSLSPLADQARDATMGLGGAVALSGDLAADLLSPWRRPQQVVVYAEQPPSLTERGFVPATSSEDASLVLIAPEDRGLFLPRAWVVGDDDLPVADPLQVLHDVRRSGGPDAEEAAHRLEDALLGPLAHQWRQAVDG